MSAVQSTAVPSGTLADITSDIVQYTPAALAAIQAAEATGLPGTTKKQLVVSALLAGSATLAATDTAQPKVAGISALVNLLVSIFFNKGA